MAALARDLANVFKVRIAVAIAASAVAGAAVAGREALAPTSYLILALTVLGASCAAGAFNQLVERDLDAKMRRTASRPFVTGTFTAGPRWVAGIMALLVLSVASAAVALGGLSALCIFAGAAVYGLVYTVWLKRRTVLNIVIGGLSGSFAVLAGAAAVDPDIGWSAGLLAAVLFLWTPPHFWALALARRDDYAAAGVPMLPVVVGDQRAARIIFGHTLLLVTLSLVSALWSGSIVYTALAGAGGLWFVTASWRLARHPNPRQAMATFWSSLGQLALLLTGAIVGG